jgi:hypothetical protein
MAQSFFQHPQTRHAACALIGKRTRRGAMRVRVLLFVLGAVALSIPFRSSASVVSICNQGDASLNVTTAVYTKSVWLGDSYHVTGWYAVEPDKCAVVYSAEDPEDVYFGFTFLGSDQSLRKYISTPSGGQDNLFKAISENFCVAVGQVFDYRTKTKGVAGGCQAGFQPLEFSLYAGLDSDNYGRVEYALFPHKDDRESGVIGTRAGTTGRLIFGDAVQFDGSRWTYANGTPLPDTLIISKTGLPPLLPKQQFSTGQAPVAENIRKIKDVLAGFQSCKTTGLFGMQITSSTFDMDDYGVVVVAQSTTTVMSDGPHAATFADGAAIGNLDLDHPAIVEQGPDCLSVRLACSNGSCVRDGDETDSSWAFYLNNSQQINIVLDALRAIAPYYPDGKGDIN